ncbi:MAG: DASH family cryptochrome [Candidatus Sumerlaeia bacterium]|nr:DASH family cryptochrome [Candidatus Sumerlaeia bacterium]
MRVLVWLRSDLRLHDHVLFSRAAQQDVEILPVFIWGQRLTGTFRDGEPRMGTHRHRFLRQSLDHLGESLASAGAPLLVCRGDEGDILPRLLSQHRIDELWCHAEAAVEERAEEAAAERACSDAGARFRRFWGHTLVHRDDLPFESLADLPDTFTEFRKAVERRGLFRAPIEAPKRLRGIDASGSPLAHREADGDVVSAGDERAVLPFRGGEGDGLARLWDYLWGRDLLRNYKETRNGLLGGDYSSKFSPWLAVGALSPRQILHEVRRYEREVVANDSTYWLVFELLWRDYFRFVALKYGSRLFKRGGLKGSPGHTAPEVPGHFDAWAAGRTGVPFVDANMRELNATGFMSNRGRQNAASYLVCDLGVDWRRGAEYFERVLLDYDPCSNWGNWAYIAGVGNDPREDRYFNVVGQARRYDTDGAYTRLWVPELAGLRTPALHEPWAARREELAEGRVALGRDYPRPLATPRPAPPEAADAPRKHRPRGGRSSSRRA